MSPVEDKQLLDHVVAALSPAPAYDIWVADDNADVRLLLCRAFKRFFPCVPVEYFSDGAAILERMRHEQRQPRLLLLDFEMPTVNGIETIERLSAEGYTPGTTVWLFSTNPDPAVVEQAYATGAHLFLQKPIGGDEFRDLAKLCLKSLDFAEAPQRPAITSRPLHVSTALAALEAANKANRGSFS